MPTQSSYSKMDSYIRSKYESRRWARDGPPPQDPSVLEDGAPSTPAETPPTPIAAPATPTSSRRSHTSNPSTGSVRVNAPGVTNRQPQPHQLLSASVAARNAQAPAPTAPAQASQPQQQQPVEQPAQTAANDLFTLDFHNPTPPAAQAQGQRKDVKQDILSLFSTPTASPQAAFPTAAGTGAGAFGQFTSAAVAVPQQQQNVWGQFGGAAQAPLQQPSQQTQQAQFQTTSMIGNSGPGMWGASSGWNAPAAATPAVNSLWGSSPADGSGNQFGGFTQAQQPQAQPQAAGFFNTSDVWAAPTTMTAAAPAAGGGFGSFGGGTQKKDDVFGDLWGGFK